MPDLTRGSQWNRWDLHVHTPCSIVQEYGGNNKDTWEKFIAELETLPNDIKVIGVNDYLFLDGYKKVLEYKKQGRLSNIELVLPVLELRIDNFVGNEKLNKINYHVIFSNDLEPEVIEEQFIKGLTIDNAGYALDPELEGARDWKALLTHESLTNLGNKIIKTTPKEKLGSSSPEFVAFSNIAFSTDAIERLLNNTYFKGKYITAIGKSEWNDFRWSGSTAKKKTIANSVDIIFTASETPEEANSSSDEFLNERVNNKIIHCSDAHSFCKDKTNTRSRQLGHCYTWIKANLTFDGLTQIKYDYPERVKIQNNNPYENNTKYVIDSISFTGQSGVIKPQSILLNRDLTTIIGSKGSGKSLLLSAFSSVSNEADYKKHDIFESDDGSKKQEVNITLRTKESEVVSKDDVSLHLSGNELQFSEPILYIGQEELAERSKNKNKVREEYLSEIGIADIPLTYNDTLTDIKFVLNQLSEAEGGKKKVCDSLSLAKGESPKEYITKKIASLKTAQEKLTDSKTKDIIDSLSTIITDGKKISIWENNNGYEDILNAAETYNDAVETFNKNLSDIKDGLKAAIEKIDEDKIKREYSQTLKAVQLLRSDKRKLYLSEKKKLEELGIQEDVPTLLKTIENNQGELAKYNKKLKELSINEQLAQSYREKLSSFFNIDNGLVQKKLGSLLHDIEEKIKDFEEDHEDSSLFNCLFSDITVTPRIFFNYRELEKDIEECFFANRVPDLHDIIFGERDIKYESLFQWIRSDFWTFLDDNRNNLLNRISGRNISGEERLKEILFSQWHKYTFVSVDIRHNFSNNLKEISEMSTGELATVLLKLILITKGLDKQIILIDQPEDNLDNDFIANGLVKLIKQLKKARQLIVVTHNANLVVMTDSEEVIVAKGIQNDYLSGGIEDEHIRMEIIRILEGGEEAFRARSKRYNGIDKGRPIA